MDHDPHFADRRPDGSLPAANIGAPSEAERMARRRFQQPKPKRAGRFWYIRIWQDVLCGGRPTRKLKRIKIAPDTVPEREVRKIAAEVVAPLNQGLVTVGAGVNFGGFIETIYKPNYLPLLARPVQNCYLSLLKLHLLPAFGHLCLRDVSRATLQGYFASRAGGVEYPTLVKIRDAMSSVMRSAVDSEYLIKNPMADMKLPPDKRKRGIKPTITPEQFHWLMTIIAEPYRTMIFTATFTGLRISELLALKWRCITDSGISVEERFYRGDWSCPKTDSSAATIQVSAEVLNRIHNLKTMTIEFKAGCAVRRYPAVKSPGSDDLVFQSPLSGKPMRDGNVLRRHLKPAGKTLGIPFLNWQCLRRSYATWMIQAGVDPKSAQAQMRHSRASTTMDIYAQTVATGQRRAVEQLSTFANQKLVTVLSQKNAPFSEQVN
jgi:integrase